MMRLEVTKVHRHSPNICELWMMLPDRSDLPEWEAGAHISLVLPVDLEGVTCELKRQYSLVGSPGVSGIYRIVVLKEECGRGGSRYIHEQVRVGQLLDVEPPVNGFPLDLHADEFVLIAGGIGITPFYSMASSLLAQKHPFKLHILTRTIDQLPLFGEIASLSTDQLHLHITGNGNRPSLADLIGVPGEGRAVYACGPNGLMQEVEQVASSLGWKKDSIHFESFGARRESEDHSISVHLAQSGLTIPVSPGTPILRSLIEAGVFAPFDCERGECGACYTSVVSGQPIHRDVCLTAEQRVAGMCTCVSWADTETLVLDL